MPTFRFVAPHGVTSDQVHEAFHTRMTPERPEEASLEDLTVDIEADRCAANRHHAAN